MVLVPQETMDAMENQKSTDKDGQNLHMDEFKRELSKILQNNTLPAEEQFKIYTQLFSRYLNMDIENRKPLKLMLQETSPSEKQEPESQFLWPASILESLPKTKRSRAALLIDEIKNNPNIKVNKTGEISIGNVLIPSSHVIDLIHDFTRQRKTNKPAIGAEALAKVLKEANIPREYIGNMDRLNFMGSETKYKEENLMKPLFRGDSNLDESWFDAHSVAEKTIQSDSSEKTKTEKRPQRKLIQRKIKYYAKL